MTARRDENPQSFARENRVIAAVEQTTWRQTVAGWSSFALALLAAWLLVPRLEPLPEPSERLHLALQLGVAPAVVLLLMLVSVWRVLDVPEVGESRTDDRKRRAHHNKQALSDTVGHSLVFVPLFLALAVAMPAERTFALPIVMALWCVGRLMYWFGRHLGYLRTPGLDWTLGATLVTLALFLTTLF